MRAHLNRSAPTVCAALYCLLFSGPAALGDEPKLSINGYDPVAYFTDSRPVAGKSEYEYLWHKLRWHFASSDHRDLFVKEPGRYAPQYDGYCAMGAADGDTAHKDTIDPEAWTIVDGKLYLAHNRYWIEKWKEEAADKIKQADLRQRYFGPLSPKSATVPVQQLAGPDFLVQVEAFAGIK